MAQEYDSGVIGDAAPQFLNNLFIRSERKGDRPFYIGHAPKVAIELPGSVSSAVFVVGSQDFVTRLEVKRSRDYIDPERGARYENYIVRVGTDVWANYVTRFGQQGIVPSA